MELSLFTETTASELENLVDINIISQQVIDFCPNYFATIEAVFNIDLLTNAWNPKKLVVNQKTFRQVQNCKNVSKSGAILAANGCLILKEGKHVPVDPSSFLQDDCVVFQTMIIPISNMLPYIHHCTITLICQGYFSALYLYDTEEMLSFRSNQGKITAKVCVKDVTHLSLNSEVLYCLSHNSKQLQLLHTQTLALLFNGLISLEQELIEYAYDNDTPAFEISSVVSMACLDNYLTLTTSNGVLLFILERKLRLAFKFTNKTVRKSYVIKIGLRYFCIALIEAQLVWFDVPEPEDKCGGLILNDTENFLNTPKLNPVAKLDHVEYQSPPPDIIEEFDSISDSFCRVESTPPQNKSATKDNIQLQQTFEEFQGAISVFQTCVADQKSIFILCQQKIDVESIYDNQGFPNKTRFAALPTKLSKKNLPLTFHKKIKSSGYSAAPTSIKYSNSQKQVNKTKQQLELYHVSQDYTRSFPMQVPPECRTLQDTPLHKATVTKLCYSYQGRKLASASSDMTINIMKTPMITKIEVTALQGHNAQINSISFSASDQMLISSSTDKSCIVWNMSAQKRGEKLLVLDHLLRPKISDQTSSKTKNPEFTDAIRQAQFYFNDQLICLATGSKLHFYQYELPSGNETDDVKRLQQKGLYKLLQSFEHPTQAHAISSFTMHNGRATSQIGILAGTNKELVVFDANVNKAIQVMNDTHQRHAHTVKFYDGSYSDQDSLNTFLTAAADNTIKLWDLRIGTPVREFMGGHQNRSLPIGFAVSNCYKYLVTGSEDRAAYVYDIGSGQVMGKTKGKDHGDAVIDVAVNPVAYEWSTACIDGHVRTFREPAVKLKTPKVGGNPPGLVEKPNSIIMDLEVEQFEQQEHMEMEYD